MKEEELKQYRSNKKYIEYLERKSEKEHYEHNTVVGSMNEFPYIKRKFAVSTDFEKSEINNRTEQQKKRQLEQAVYEVEQYIEEIQDAEIKMIFSMYYIDGMTQNEIANHIHLDRSRVSRKISNYIKRTQSTKKV